MCHSVMYVILTNYTYPFEERGLVNNIFDIVVRMDS